MSAYPILGVIVTLVPLAMIISIVIIRGKKLFDQ